MNTNIPLALSYDDVLLVPQFSEIDSRSDVDLSVQLSPKINLKIPITSSPMSDISSVKFAIKLSGYGGLSYLHRFSSPEKQADNVAKIKSKGAIVGAAVGCRDGFINRAEMLVKAGVDVLLLDVTHGHMRRAIDATRELKNKFGASVDIHSGLVATYDGAHRLFAAGADCVHVGIGAGSICTTRINAGIGVPNITTINDCAKAAVKHKKTIVADAGIKNPGDVVKAIAMGASAVRIGNLFASCEEAAGKKVIIKGIKYKIYRGSTSIAQKKSHIRSGLKRNSEYNDYIEGVEGAVVTKWKLSQMIKRFSANLRSGYSYCGARNGIELKKNAQFIRITPSGLAESRPHDLEAINN
jgi:IMP dehydrogenase